MNATPLLNLKSLDDIAIETPCKMNWDLMDGDERKRHCSRCKKNVYNLSAMKKDDALKLLRDSEGEVCGRVFRRPDGTVVTADCPSIASVPSSRRFQFSIASLLILLTASGGLFAASPWIGKKIGPIVESWFAKPAPAKPAIAVPIIEVGELMIDETVLPPEEDKVADEMMGGIGFLQRP